MKKGYTLSEVLITLGVIGVISAMTLPTLIHKIQTAVLKNQYKRVYSNYSNALQRYIIDNDGIPDCAYGVSGVNSSVCASFFQNFVKNNIKYTKFCNNNALSNGCIPRYSRYATADGGCSGYSENKINNINSAWILNDGTIMITYGAGGSMPLFLVDINGMKGPNKGGYDLFSFELKKKENTVIITPGGCMPIENGGFNPQTDFNQIYK